MRTQPFNCRSCGKQLTFEHIRLKLAYCDKQCERNHVGIPPSDGSCEYCGERIDRGPQAKTCSVCFERDRKGLTAYGEALPDLTVRVLKGEPAHSWKKHRAHKAPKDGST